MNKTASVPVSIAPDSGLFNSIKYPLGLKKEWKKMGFIDGNGTTAELHHYSISQ